MKAKAHWPLVCSSITLVRIYHRSFGRLSPSFSPSLCVHCSDLLVIVPTWLLASGVSLLLLKTQIQLLLSLLFQALQLGSSSATSLLKGHYMEYSSSN
ncbi:hypothetical protein L3X38_038531 [Prunus dulcis]|uniref:Uncharacterized protein n=1 Tax=Prunus dulcis TaxID=3755 RepID=A0AAD4V6I0_PRUDU|nr:hypothetical protein L3X38_038531 [Prunus dulcis]